MRERLTPLAPFALAAGATLFLLSGPVLGATTDDEEYRNTILSLVLHAKAVLQGDYPFWTSALGFGLPHPLHPTFFFHPLMPIFGLASPGTAVRVLYACHGVLGAAGAWWTVRQAGGSAWAAAIGTATWALATPALNYSVSDFWVSNFLGWSLAPWLLYWAQRVLDDDAPGQPWLAALAFGLVAGFCTVHGHAGHQPPLFLPVAALCVASPGRVWRRIPALAFATGLGCLIASPVVARLLLELPRFPDVPRRLVDVQMGVPAAIDLVARPFTTLTAGSPMAALLQRGTRGPFIGAPLFGLVLASIAGLGRRPYPRGLVVTFLLALGLTFLPNNDAPTIMSGTYAFRDPMVLSGLILGGLALDALARRAPAAALAIGTAQIAVLVTAAYPFVADAWGHGGVSDPSRHRTALTAALQDWRPRLPGRWYLAPQLDELVRRGSLYDDGLWRDTWAYHDLPVVNGVFKGISTDALFPSGALPLGRIEGHPATVQQAPTLDLLGIGAVLALDGEPVAPSFEEVARFPTHLGPAVRLLRNSHAAPGAAFVAADRLAITPERLPDCRAGFLCFDLSAAAATAVPATHVTRAGDSIEVTFAPEPRTRPLLVAEMYRPEWVAESGGVPLSVSSAWKGVLLVEVPPGTDTVTLHYRPMVIEILTAVSGVSLAGGSALWLALRRRQAAGPSGSPNQSTTA